MAGAREAMAVGPECEDLTAPDGVVTAVTGAVEGDSDDGFADTTVFGQQRHHMCVMVLDKIQRPIARMPSRPASGVVPGMQIGRQARWPAPDSAELTHCLLEGAQRRDGGHVTDVPG